MRWLPRLEAALRRLVVLLAPDRSAGRTAASDARRDALVRTLVVAPAAVFAPNAHARARLLRQLHAAGHVTDRRAELVDGRSGSKSC